MSEWDDRIKNHAIWETMRALGPVIDQAAARDDVDPVALSGLDRIRAVLTFTGKKLAGAVPQLMEVRSLETLDSHLRGTFSEVSAYVQNGSSNHLVSANSQADSALIALASVNFPFVSEDLEALSRAGTDYRNTLDQNLRHIHEAYRKSRTELEELRRQIQSDSANLQQRVGEITNDVNNERTRLTSLTSEFQSQFSAAQETRNRESAEAQTNRQEKFGALISDYKTELTVQTAAFAKERDEAVQKYKADVTELINKYDVSAKQILDDIDSKRKQVEKLVGVIGNLGVTSGYLIVANDAKAKTWRWQMATLLGLVVFIGFAFKAFLPSLTPGTFHWESFAGRVVLSLAVALFAAYARSQADRYFELEKRNRKLALELEAIGPYIANLPLEKQVEFRLQIGERSFGRDEMESLHKGRKSPATLADILGLEDFRKLVTESVTAAIKATVETVKK